jgi:hypothetical protein
MIRTRHAPRLALLPTLLAAFLLGTAIPAFATCTSNVPGSHVFALNTDVCAAVSGTYTPTGTSAILPFPDPGYGFVGYNGGIVISTGAVRINTQNANGADAVYSSVAGSQVNLFGATTISTVGANAYGVLAEFGGAVSSKSTLTIGTTGGSGLGLYAVQTGSTITATGAVITTSGALANGVEADYGGAITLSGGGSVTVSGAGAIDVTTTGGSVNLTGTTLNANGGGSSGIAVVGSGSSFIGTGVAVNSTGYGASNTGVVSGPLTFPSDGTLRLTNSTLLASGAGAYGVFTANGATTTLTGDTIATSGANSNGVVSQAKGVTNLSGGSVTTSGFGSFGVYSSGAGSQVNANSVAVSTSGGGYSNAYSADTGASLVITGGSATTSGTDAFVVGSGSGATVTMTGTTLLATGVGSGGIGAYQGGNFTGSGLTITTHGNINSSDGYTANGIGNTNMPGIAAGTVNVSNSSVTTTGTSAYGVFNYLASNTNLTNVTVKTAGSNATGAFASGNGAAISLNGGSVSTSGDYALGLRATGAGATIATSNGTMIATSGVGSYGVQANTGATVTLRAGGAVATTGQDAHALFVTGAGSRANLSGANRFATEGNGAVGLYAAAGGVITATGPLTISTAGGVSSSTGLGAFGVNADGAGSRISLAAADIATAGAGATALYVSDAANSGAAGSVAASGTLNITTTNSQAVAVALQGNGASIAATGGGTISAAGVALQFLAGVNQSATFDNFTISNLAGDLIFVDPSSATIDFNHTVANAGNSNLLDAVGGSVITLNANASMLTGAILTDAASTTNVALTNGSLWTVTGNSTVTNLSNNAGSIVFAPPSGGVYRTLTVGNYAGTGGSMTFNAALGAGSGADQLVISGGAATGSTVVMIKNVGGSGVTSGASFPLITAINGGTIAPGAFALSGPLVADGYQYKLELVGSDQDDLVASPASTPTQVASSLKGLAESHQSQMITGRILGSILVGANEQVNCSSCSSGFAGFGSFALGEHGRWTLTDRLSLLAGVSWDSYSAQGVKVDGSPILAAALTYDLVDWGRQRPFFEAGGSLAPYQEAHFTRSYVNGAVVSSGVGTSTESSASAFVRAGWVARLTPIDEAAIYGDFNRNWQRSSGYSETTTPGNPFAATVGGGLDTMNIARVGAQYTHLFAGNIEANVNGGFAQAFAANFGSNATVAGFGAVSASAPTAFNWFEFGGRLGYRVNPHMVIDAFMLGTLGAEPAGNTIHGGVGLRFSF